MPIFTFRIQTKSKKVAFHFIPVLQEFIKLLHMKDDDWKKKNVLRTILINLANGKQI